MRQGRLEQAIDVVARARALAPQNADAAQWSSVVADLLWHDDEALRMANDSEYGLAASVWTKDLSRALSVSDRLNAGTVSVNTVDALSAMTPFGGMKQSGFGRYLSIHSFDKYCALKTVWVKY